MRRTASTPPTPTTVVQVETKNRMVASSGTTMNSFTARSKKNRMSARNPLVTPRNQSRWRTNSAPPTQIATARQNTKTPKAGGRMALRKKSSDSCEVIRPKPMAELTALKKPAVTATTTNSRLKSDEPLSRREVRAV